MTQVFAAIGKKSTPKAPKTPDYAAAATAQGDANIKAAQTDAELTNTNQITPYGNQNFVKDPNSNQWTSTVSLSPEQQNLYNIQTEGDTRLGEMANSQLGRINDAVSQPFDFSKAPDRVNSVAGPDYQKYGNTDYGAQAQQVEDTLYNSAAKRLDPQFAQQENSERTRLINSGVPEGSEAFNNAMTTFANQKRDAYGDARDRAVIGRGAEQDRLQNDELKGLGFNNSTEAQKYADAITSGNFQNQQRGAAIDEESFRRSEPLNLYSALNSGSQVTNPTFRGTGQVQGPAAAPVFAGAQAQGQDALSLYNAQMDAANSARGGLTNVLGTLGGGLLGGILKK